ncbi:hypothetical protein E4T39_04410 [Aureobasidium subglaciale]|nr:hypothetical protein E4T39_04410 [Aureobasidium subglaciale]
MSPPVLAVSRPLAPQPVRSNDAAVLQPLQNSYPLKSTRSRRGTINAACQECRLKKLKCDGTRPRCQRCVVKGIDSCEYTVNPGETRFTALKRKNASLATESDRMQKFIEALRSASSSQAQGMLDDLRTCDGAKQILSTLTLGKSQPHPLHHRNSDYSISSAPSPPSNADTTQTPHSSRSRSSGSNTESIPSAPFENDVLPVETPYQPFSDFERPLPALDVLRKCINAFYIEAGKLFHVFLTSHLDAQFEVLSSQGDTQALRAAACELCAVGALGSQYIKETLPEGTEKNMYSCAKHLLEDVVSIDANRAAKVCAMLGMFNIMSKEKVAMTFVGLQLSKDIMNLKDFEIDGEDLEEKVTTEMIKIAVIKFDMLRLSLSFKGLSARTVETITNDLQHWHQNLPHEMHSTELENNPDISFELRRTIYYVNFLYFGAQIMLLRRVLQSMHDQSLLTGHEDMLNDLIAQAKFAARESAKLFRRLYVEGGIIQRCWICVFQAYSSCLLILHHVAEMLYAGGQSASDLDDELDLARACLDFLGVCSQKDVAARQFHSTLIRFYTILHTTAMGQHPPGPDVVNTARDLHELIRRPFKTAGEASSECCYLWKNEEHQRDQGQQHIDNIAIQDVANAPDQRNSWQRIDGIRNDGMIHDLLSRSRTGHFLPGFESSAWTDGTQMS